MREQRGHTQSLNRDLVHVGPGPRQGWHLRVAKVQRFHSLVKKAAKKYFISQTLSQAERQKNHYQVS